MDTPDEDPTLHAPEALPGGGLEPAGRISVRRRAAIIGGAAAGAVAAASVTIVLIASASPPGRTAAHTPIVTPPGTSSLVSLAQPTLVPSSPVAALPSPGTSSATTTSPPAASTSPTIARPTAVVVTPAHVTTPAVVAPPVQHTTAVVVPPPPPPPSPAPKPCTYGTQAGCPASVWSYVGSRDVANVPDANLGGVSVNQKRAAQGWAPLTTAAYASAGNCFNSSCLGHYGGCGLLPNGIGTESQTSVRDGQYRDQYGACEELMSL